LSFLSRIFGHRAERAPYASLYAWVVGQGRDPAWYREGAVPDTLDGRFDMIAAILALVLLRLEQAGDTSKASALIAETFIEDMEGSIRQMGIGDLMVGKNVGRMMSALGGRLTAFRAAIAAGSGFDGPVRRNIFHDAPPSDAAAAFVSRRLQDLHDRLAAMPVDDILTGDLP